MSDTPRPHSRMMKFDETPAQAIASITQTGGLAWVTADYGLNMSGRQEFMGNLLNWFTPEQVTAAARIATEVEVTN